MKRFILLFLPMFLFIGAKAQNLVYTPEQHRIDTVIYENYEVYDINITTPNPEAITFKWVVLSNTLPSAWSYSLCDHGQCYVGIPSTTETMDAISLSQAQSGTQGFLKINLTTGLNYGNGKVVFYVYDASNINRGDTISFDIRWPAPNSVAELAKENNQFTVYPNPAQDQITFSNLTNENMAVEIINTIGETVYTSSVIANQTHNIDLSLLEAGIYFVSVIQGNQRYVEKLIVK